MLWGEQMNTLTNAVKTLYYKPSYHTHVIWGMISLLRNLGFKEGMKGLIFLSIPLLNRWIFRFLGLVRQPWLLWYRQSIAHDISDLRAKDIPENQYYWVTQVVRSRFCAKYNITYDKTTQTRFSRRGYMAQVVPALMFSKAIQHAFKIPVGQGRIRNIDESMCFTYNTTNKSWTVWIYIESVYLFNVKNHEYTFLHIFRKKFYRYPPPSKPQKIGKGGGHL